MSTRFAPAPALVAALLGAGVALAGLALETLAGDPAGRLLVGLCSAGLLVEGVRALVVRPTLAVEEDGLVVRPGLRRRRLAWSEVGAVRAHTSRRLLITRSLEIDVGEELVVLPHYRLGVAPGAAAAAIEAGRPVSR